MTDEPEITHQGLCTTPGCPWPSDPDMHIPWCGHGLAYQHQHIPKLSQDPNAKIQAIICPRCHDRIDNGLWSNHIKLFPDGSVHYFILDEHGKTKAERVVGQGGVVVADDEEVSEMVSQSMSEMAGGLTTATPVDLSQDASYDSTCLTLRENLPYERWMEIGGFLQHVERSVGWWIGDWLQYGERTYGERYAQAIEATGMKVERLKNYVWVAGAIEKSTRVDNLSWSHHREVAALTPPQQAEWLQRAQDEGLTTRQLHECVAVHRDPPPGCQHEWVCKLCGKLR